MNKDIEIIEEEVKRQNPLETIEEPAVITPKEDKYEILLQGKALQIYWLILERREIGVREIQKELGYSSPGVVSYQIQKLVSEGLVAKNEESEKYIITKFVKPGVLGFFVKFRNNLIPRFTIYLLILLPGHFSFLLLGFLLGDEFISHPATIILFITLVACSFFFMYESRMIRKIRPKL